MKKILKFSFLMILAIYFLSACQPESDFPEIEEPTSLKAEKLQGTWTLSSVIQVDQEAEDNGFPEDVQSLDITNLFDFQSITLTFNLDTEGRPSDFTVNRPETVPNFFVESGTWSLPHPVFATEVYLTNPISTGNAILTVERITSNEFKFRVNRKDEAGTSFIRYDYTFTK